jgi:heterogeneous nuclear ribonucleoprotein A1/A3
MLRRTIALALLTVAAGLITASEAHAWGAFHAGYTHVGYGGIQHYGYTAARGPYGGVYGGAHYGGYGAYGGYHAGYGYGARGVYGGYHAYTPYSGGGYAVGGYRYGAYGYPGVYRRW